MTSIPPVLLSVGTLAVTFYVVRAWLWPTPIPGIPHNDITSFWADMATMGKVKKEDKGFMQDFFGPTAKRLGPLYQLLLGPLGKILVLSDTQEIEDLLLRRSKSLDASPIATSVIGGVLPLAQASLPTGGQWKKHRHLVGPSMAPKYLEYMTPRITLNIDQLISFWKEKMRVVSHYSGTCFPCETDLQFSTMDTMGDIIFGESFHNINNARECLSAEPPVIDEFGGTTFLHLKGSPLHEAAVYLLQSFTGGLGLPRIAICIYWLVTKARTQWKESYDLMMTLISRRIGEARQRAAAMGTDGSKPESADCIVDMIMEREGREDPEKMTDDEIRDELLGLIFGGQDTTASALSFGLKYLSNHPQVQVRLRKELLTNLVSPESRFLTYSEVSGDGLPYLDAVVSEILRCACVAGGMQRRTTEDLVILGHTVPKGTDILFLTGFAGLETDEVYAAQAQKLDHTRSKASVAQGLSKRLWDHADIKEFKPERWLVEHLGPSGDKIVKYSAKQGVSMPFGLGARACFGFKLATLEMKLFIASLNLAFFFDRVPEPLNSFEVKEIPAAHPRTAYVALKEWDAEDDHEV